MAESDVHILPEIAWRQHAERGIDCWCSPTYFVPCDECEHGRGCWKCDAGKVWLTLDEARGEKRPIVIVHNDRARSEESDG